MLPRSDPVDRATYVYGRGDYGSEYATDLVAKIDGWNCALGCQRAGDDAARAEFGPGGNCSLLAQLFAKVPVPEFDPRQNGIHCIARVPLDAPVVLDGQEALEL